MAGIVFIIGVSLQLIPLVIMSPYVIGVLAMIVVGAVLVSRAATRTVPRNSGKIWELGLLLLPPLAMLVWGLAWWPDDAAGPSPNEDMLLAVLYIIGSLHLVLLMWIIWRHRLKARLAGGLAVASSIWAAAALFTATMAIRNTWL